MALKTHVKELKIALLVAALMLCFAVIPSLPSVFYVVLRWVVCGAAGFAAFQIRDEPPLNRHFWPLVILAVLFNPLVPVLLTPLTWLFLFLGTAVYFLTLSKKF